MTHKRSHQSVTLGLIQMKAERDKKKNLSRAVGLIEKAARRGAQLICLQELFTSLYFCQNKNEKNFSLAEPVLGESFHTLSKVARRLQVVIVAPIFEERTLRLYHNTALVIDADGSFLGMYRKMHLPHDPGFWEKFYFSRGDLGFRHFNTRYAKIGVLICWDQWFPEAARLIALTGAEILFTPSAIGWFPACPCLSLPVRQAGGRQAAGRRHEKRLVREKEREAWQVIQRGHAIANGLYVASVNRVGLEGNIQFWGSSFICDPFGQVTAQAGDKKEELLIDSCDLRKIDSVRRSWPFLKNRRFDKYHPLLSSYPPSQKTPGLPL